MCRFDQIVVIFHFRNALELVVLFFRRLFLRTILGQVIVASTIFATSPIDVDSLFVGWAFRCQMSLFFADEASGKGQPFYSMFLGAHVQGVLCRSTFIATLGFVVVVFFRTIFHPVASLSTMKTRQIPLFQSLPLFLRPITCNLGVLCSSLFLGHFGLGLGGDFSVLSHGGIVWAVMKESEEVVVDIVCFPIFLAKKRLDLVERSVCQPKLFFQNN